MGEAEVNDPVTWWDLLWITVGVTVYQTVKAIVKWRPE